MYKEIYETYKNVSKDNVKRKLFNQSKDSAEDIIYDIKKNKIVIFTAFTGDYDSLKIPDIIDENCDYVCFSDNPNLKSDFWDIRMMEESTLDNNRKAKQYKVLSHKYLPEYKYSFWLDGTFKIKGSIREYIYKYLKKDSKILCVVHPERDCLYDEFKSSKKIIRYPAVIMEKQIKKYEKEGFPKKYGLPVLGAIFREHNSPDIIKLMEDWWDEIIEFSNQDQLSFPYVAWKNNIHPSVSRVYYWNNEYWLKEGKYHHNVLLLNPTISDNLMEKLLKNAGKEEVNLNKEEMFIAINEIQGLSGHYKYLDKRIKDNEKEINDILNSHSWKLTNLLRDISSKILYNPLIYTLTKSKLEFNKYFNVYKNIKASGIFNEDKYIKDHLNRRINPILDYIYYSSNFHDFNTKKEYIDEIFDFNYYINEYNISEDPLIHYFSKGFYEDNKINNEGEDFIENIYTDFKDQYEIWLDEKITYELSENNYITDFNILRKIGESSKVYNTNSIKVAIFLEDNYLNMNESSYFRFNEVFKKLSENKKFHFFIYGMETLPLINFNNFLNVKQFDIIIVQRISPYIDLIFEKAKENNIKIIYDIDDDLLNINEANSSFSYISPYFNSIKNYMDNSDIITVNTNYLQDKLEKDNVQLVKNPFPNNLLKIKYRENKANIIRIGYFGIFKSKNEIEPLKNTISKLKDEFSKINILIEFEIIGDIEFQEDWIKTIKLPSYSMSTSTFYKWLNLNIQWDIGIIINNKFEFDRGSSQLRYMNLTSFGSVTLLNKFEGSSEFVTDTFNGFIFEDTNDLYIKIEKLILDSSLMENIFRNAKEDISKNYRLDKAIEKWDEILD